MIYYHPMMKRDIPAVMDFFLQRYFPEDTWGAQLIMDIYGRVDCIEVCKVEKVGNKQEWTHYANIQSRDNIWEWEVNEQFKGDNKDEMWIYGYYKSFGRAVRNLATKGTKNRKPIQIYK